MKAKERTQAPEGQGAHPADEGGAAGRREARPVPWRLGDLLAVIGLAMVVGIVAALTASAVVATVDASDGDLGQLTGGLAATLAFDVALLGLAAAFSVGKYRCTWGQLGFRRPHWGSWWLPLATLAALWLVLGIYLAIVEAGDLQRLRPQSTLDEDAFNLPLVAALAGVLALVVAPLAEETFFRGFLFAGLRRRWGLPLAVLASSLLFGLAHADLGSIIPFSLMGVLLALAYALSGSLWVTIGSHLMFNAVSFIAALATGAGGGG